PSATLLRSDPSRRLLPVRRDDLKDALERRRDSERLDVRSALSHAGEQLRDDLVAYGRAPPHSVDRLRVDTKQPSLADLALTTQGGHDQIKRGILKSDLGARARKPGMHVATHVPNSRHGRACPQAAQKED